MNYGLQSAIKMKTLVLSIEEQGADKSINSATKSTAEINFIFALEVSKNFSRVLSQAVGLLPVALRSYRRSGWLRRTRI